MQIRRKRPARRPGWLIVALLVLIVSGYGIVKLGQGLYHLWELSSMLKEEMKSLEETQKHIAELEKEIDRLKNDFSYIEKIAREDYGMIKDGEEVYRVTEPPEDAKK